jgi:hypothetical protein
LADKVSLLLFFLFEGAIVMSAIPKRKAKVRTNSVQAGQETPPSHEEAAEKLWAARGAEDVFFQREAQITWWSVLGGIAVAALLTELDSVPLAFKLGNWYVALYFLATCLVIVTSWVQTAWGSLILKWPLSISTSLSLFFLGLSLSVAALNITQPAVWYAAMSVVLLTGLYNQRVFSKNHAWIAFSPELVEQARASAWIYAGMTAFAIAYTVYLVLRPSVPAEVVGGMIAFVVSVFTLLRQHLEMTEEKQKMGIA